MLLVALGANLPNSEIGTPLDACEKALDCLTRRGVAVIKRSRWYQSAPVPRSDQPDFINGVAVVSSALSPADLLALLHDIEAELGRKRERVNEAREIDLDLLSYGDQVIGWPVSPVSTDKMGAEADNGLILPHPRLHDRAFVLLPLRDVAPDWRHPVSGQDVEAMIRVISSGSGADLSFGDQICEPLD
ncbi:MAG: 2-amino-4-hydroxy-6-hydroxymethyldihydropteridine diphosphokinase [Rhodospirillales bacterium]|nr:2-amino-4-hydroxy-6-hydroxymethyldihydropteridine diphosphokinase [Rhodospirillales bacterium]